MNYGEENSVLKTNIAGSRQASNIFWALIVSLGGIGFFLTGLSSFFNKNLLFLSDSTEIAFVPQGIVLLFLWNSRFSFRHFSNLNCLVECRIWLQ